MFFGEMFGRLVASAIVVALAIGVWILWPTDGTDTTTTTADQSSTTTMATTTTTPPPETTTTVDDLDVIDTAEEAEQILKALWLGWFEGIYNQDEARIKEVVASQNQLDAARAAFGVMTFESAPTAEGIVLTDVEILRADEECTAIWAELGVRARSSDTQGVHLLRRAEDRWKLVNLWPLRGDLWEQDCEASLEPLS